MTTKLLPNLTLEELGIAALVQLAICKVAGTRGLWSLRTGREQQ